MNTKDHKIIAEAIKKARLTFSDPMGMENEGATIVLLHLCNALKADNPKTFNEVKFIKDSAHA